MDERVHLLRPLVLAAAVLMDGGTALAHHPGSHAYRQPDGRVRVEVAAQATDACTRVATILPGTPAGVAPVPGSAAVVARLERRTAEPCATVVTAVKAEAVLDLGPGVRQILLYVTAPDGTVAATERLPIR
jgi:hypothetical protein